MKPEGGFQFVSTIYEGVNPCALHNDSVTFIVVDYHLFLSPSGQCMYQLYFFKSLPGVVQTWMLIPAFLACSSKLAVPPGL